MILQGMCNEVALSAPALVVVMAVLAERAGTAPMTEERVVPTGRACAP